jgi:hypothetical protein
MVLSPACLLTRDEGTALTSLLAPAPRAGLDPTEYLALLGALGVLVGLALATTDASAA